MAVTKKKAAEAPAKKKSVPAARKDEVLLEVRIRERAYQIWEEEGRPQGYHLEHWLKAKSEILGH